MNITQSWNTSNVKFQLCTSALFSQFLAIILRRLNAKSYIHQKLEGINLTALFIRAFVG